SAPRVAPGNPAGVSQKVLDRNGGAVIRDAGKMFGDRVSERELALLLKAQDGRGGELLGERCKLEQRGGGAARRRIRVRSRAAITHAQRGDDPPIAGGEHRAG